MAFGRNIPQEQEMLKQLPDEQLESGLNAGTGESPFTQFLGAIEMTKRVQQRKSAANTLAGQEVQPGTVVGRMMAKRSEIGPPQAAPNFSHGGIAGQSSYGQPQDLGQPRPMQMERPPPMQSYGIGGVVQGALAIPGNVQEGMGPRELLQLQIDAAQGNGTGPQPGFAHGGRVPQNIPSYAHGTTGVMTPEEAEAARRAAYLKERRLPAGRGAPTLDELMAVTGTERPRQSQSFPPPTSPEDHAQRRLDLDSSTMPSTNPGFIQSQKPAEPGPIGRFVMDPLAMFRSDPKEQEPVAPAVEEEVEVIQNQMTEEKGLLGIDQALAEEHGETDVQRSQRFRRAAALGAMAASFGRNSSFFAGLTEGTAEASGIMQAGDSESRDRLESESALENRNATAGQLLALKVKSLQNDMAKGVVGTRIKMVKVAQEAVMFDVQNGVTDMPEEQEVMNRLVEEKMVSMFGTQTQAPPSTNEAVLGTKE